MQLRFFKDDIGAIIPFVIKEKNAAGVLTVKNLTGLTVTIEFEDRDGNKVTVSGSNVTITTATSGEGEFTVTAALTATVKAWKVVQVKITSGATYIEHSDPKTIKIGAIAGT